MSGDGAEQLVQQVGEEGFNDPRLMVGDRHEVGPVVGDGDGRILASFDLPGTRLEFAVARLTYLLPSVGHNRSG